MSKKYAKFIKVLNKILYVSSAAMLIAGAFLTIAPQAVAATPTTMQLNLSHIDCVSNSVEVHFVLLNVPDGTTPGALTFTAIINGGTEGSYTISAPSSHTGNVWHYYTYFSTNGIYDVTSGSVVVGLGTVSLHNPHDYSGETQNCVVDLCTNIAGNQTAVPAGYEDPDLDKVCTVISVPGCTDPTATNFNPAATVNDGSCIYPPVPVPGCTDPTATNFNPAATVDDASCTYPPVPVPGCTDPTATNFNPAATVDDASCTYPPVPVPGCTDPTALNYNAAATVDDDSCTYPPAPVPGCTDPTALNYNATATVDDDSCTYPPVPVPGCTDPTATNFNPAATVDDDSCTYPPDDVPGCTDDDATNYNPAATVDDGSCTYLPDDIPGCTDPTATNYDAAATVDDDSCKYDGETPGCTDPTAQNYNADATVDDGSCTFKKTSNPPKELSVEIDPFCTYEGLMQWTVINPYDTNITLNRFTVDGVNQGGFSVPPGEHDLVVTELGTHTVVLYFGEAGLTDSLTYTIDVCPLQIPVTGGDVLIPVTGADETGKLGMGFGLAGVSLVGMAMLLSALRKIYQF